MKVLLDNHDATQSIVTPWERLSGETSVALQVRWRNISGTGTLYLELSNDGETPSIADSATVSGDNSQDALLWDFKTAAAFWRVRYDKGNVTAGDLRITAEIEP